MLSLAITFVPHLVLVRYLTTEAYGHWAYALSLVAVGKTYALGFNEAMSRFVPIYHAKRESSKVLGSIVVVFSVSLLISGLLIATFAVASQTDSGSTYERKRTGWTVADRDVYGSVGNHVLLIMNLFACFARAREIFWGRYIVPPRLRAIVITLVVFRHSELQSLAYGYHSRSKSSLVVPFGALVVCELRRQNCCRR